MNIAPPAPLLAASILFSLPEPALPQTPSTVTITINSEGDNRAVNWGLPATVQLSASTPGLTYAQWLSAGGDNEVGSPLFSGTVDPNASFYRLSNVSGFPIPSNYRCPCPYLADQISLGTSFLAINTNTPGFCKIWISACAMGQCNDPVLGLYRRYCQMRHSSGDPSQNLPATLQIGVIPLDGICGVIESFGGYTIQGTPCPSGPTITMQPMDQNVPCGSNATFTVEATGTDTLTYQWCFRNAPLTDKGTLLTGSQTSMRQIEAVTWLVARPSMLAQYHYNQYL